MAAASQSIDNIAQATDQENQLTLSYGVLRFVYDYRWLQLYSAANYNEACDCQNAVLGYIEDLYDDINGHPTPENLEFRNVLDTIQDLDFTVQTVINFLYDYIEILVTTGDQARIVCAFTNRPVLIAVNLDPEIIDDVVLVCTDFHRLCIQHARVVLHQPEDEDED